ncbi:fimbrial protein [Providencia sp. Je.9.19]|uniref:fimbrial protein n=1 Tax=unclassified Providencia TaxID=2633465 RepID=UPI003DA8E11C
MRDKMQGIGLGLWILACGMLPTSAFAANSVTVNFKGNLILNPPCELTGTGSNTVEVDFKDMVIRKITGTNFQQPLPYKLTCDAEDATRVALTIKGTGSSFNNAALKTSNTNLGLRFATMSGSSPTFVGLGQPIVFTNNQRPTFNVYPLINSGVAASSIAAGGFTASATLEASYP